MKGVLFSGGRQPDLHIAKKIISSFDICVAADSGLDTAFEIGVVPDYVVGDMDSLADHDLLKQIPSERILSYSVDKDLTDTEIALEFLKTKGVDEIILIGGSGGRLDHLLAIRTLFESPLVPSLWIGEETIVVACGCGSFYKGCSLNNLVSSDPISVFPAGSGIHQCDSTDFYWNLNTVDWDSGKFSLSNKSISGSLNFISQKGLFLVMYPLNKWISCTPIY